MLGSNHSWLFAALHFFLIVGVSNCCKEVARRSSLCDCSRDPQQAYKEFLPSILHTFGESKLTTYLVS
jgi:hypothetical protein